MHACDEVTPKKVAFQQTEWKLPGKLRPERTRLLQPTTFLLLKFGRINIIKVKGTLT